MYHTDETHDPARQSWVASANGAASDFPVQNLPFGRFRRAGHAQEPWRIGVAIGDQILDLRAAAQVPAWSDDVAQCLQPLAAGDLNAFMQLGVDARRALRRALFDALAIGGSAAQEHEAQLRDCLIAQIDAEYSVACRIGDYTDFYTGIHHATTVGRLLRPDHPLLPNYHWLPIGYHGRASSIVISGTTVRRPHGQTAGGHTDVPVFGPCQRLDFELELGFLMGTGNALGEPIPIAQAEDALFGVVLLNDWSARDIQAWEYQPLGPFLAKSFASTVSPWIVTMQALAPFRRPFVRDPQAPQPLAYLDDAGNRAHGALDIQLEVHLQTAAMRAQQRAPARLAYGNAAQAMYWTPAQLVAHHTVNGCNLQAGDLLGSGTLSGPLPEQAGSLLELTAGGKDPITLPGGQTRTFLQDGDTVTLSASCESPRAQRIGFGACSGTVMTGQ